ncbi:phospholipase [Actinokineospora xionganensis]|uniref:Phospholipase n=1 Tax=Actinokineospora xionganensis TaxID=2684470 RepID=A0ABR7L9S8_9PSEU|nr:phospholipase [Actinokineospora xionganensis]MBC6449415.1 phospholipase [Actinokineospora xionganensis]
MLAVRAMLATVIMLVIGAGTAAAELPQTELRATTDTFLFTLALPRFAETRVAQPFADQIDWSSDGCSSSPDAPLGFNFLSACHRHDFGYRNYKSQARFDEEARLSIDNVFRADLYSVCGRNWLCKRTADIYYAAVREFGGGYRSTAEALRHARSQEASLLTSRVATSPAVSSRTSLTR